MSFNSRNLSYEKNEPPFLRQLRSEYGEGNALRHQRPNPPRGRPKNTDDDDEPTYVDEESNEVISKENYEALLRSDDQLCSRNTGEIASDVGQPSTLQHDAENEATVRIDSKIKQKVAEIGGSKKRKQAKVVGNEAEPPNKLYENITASRKPKQKKKIKLSFDEAEGH